ncbi:unnamed protein product, partial [Effrenium voratum]
ALAQRTLRRYLEEKRVQDELFAEWRAEVQEAQEELREQIRTTIRKDLAEARENQLHQEIQFQSKALNRLQEETLKQQHELDTVKDTLQRRHQAALDNYRFSLEVVQEEFAECQQEKDELAEECKETKTANEELKSEVEALEDELESIGRFRAIEVEQQQRLRTLLASSDSDRLLTFFDIWKRYTQGEWGLRRVAGDLEKVHGFCHDRDIQVCAGSVFDELLTKASLLSRVQRFFCARSKMLFLLFYAGHGRPGTGDWIMEDEDVSFADILHLWQHGLRMPGASLLIISDACHSGAWVTEAARAGRSDVMVQASCAALEKALDGVFISLWLLVQCGEVAPQHALKHLESLERHPCIYKEVQNELPSLGSGWPPPKLLELPSKTDATASATRRNSAVLFVHQEHCRIRRRAARRRERSAPCSGQALPLHELGAESCNFVPERGRYPKGLHPEAVTLVEQLAEQDCDAPVLVNLLDRACAAAADSQLRSSLISAGLQEALGSILLGAADAQNVDLARAALCSLWNLASSHRAAVAGGTVPHALCDALAIRSPVVVEWSARVVWLLAEEPAAREHLLACNVLHALRSCAQSGTQWVAVEDRPADALGWTDGEDRATKDWKRCLLTWVLIGWANVVEDKFAPMKLLRSLRAWMPYRGLRPEPEGMTWMQADGRMRRQAERTWLREVVACWHGFVASLLPPLQLLCWLRPFIPHRGLRPEQEEEKVMTWPELEERMREQSFRYCLLTSFEAWLTWLSTERRQDSVMWVIDTSRWPRPWHSTERTWAPAGRSQRRAEWARHKAVQLRDAEEERQRQLRQRAEEVAAVASHARQAVEEEVLQDRRRRPTLRPYEFPAVLRNDTELSPRRETYDSPRASPKKTSPR